MSFRPDTTPDPKKEAILAKHHFTRVFLDTSLLRLNPALWHLSMAEHGEKIANGIESRLGKTWIATLLMPQTILMNHLEIFAIQDNKTKAELVTGIIKVGYDLETSENQKVLFPDILKRFGDLAVFNPRLLKTPEGILRIASTFTGLLDIGRYIRELPAEGVQTLYDTQKPSLSDPFNKFLEELDLSDI